MARNWLLVLGLDFDPASNDEELLKQVIADKRDEFDLKGAGDGEDAGTFRELAEAIDAGEAEDALLDWTERIDQEKAARKLVYGSINKAIEETYLIDPSMGEAVVANITSAATAAIRSEAGAPAYELSADLVAERIERFKERYGDQLGATVMDEGHVDAVYEKYLGGLDGKSKKFDGYARDLANLGMSDLYDFLEKAGVRNARSLPAAQLAAAAKEIAKNPPKHLKDPASTTNLAHNAAEVFGDAQLADRYASFLKSQEVNDLFRDVRNFCAQTGTIPRNLAIRTVQNIAASINEPKDAPDLLMGFARRNNMTVGAAYDDLIDALGGGSARKKVRVVMDEEREGLGTSAARTLSAMPAKTKRAIAIAVVAVIVVVVGYFAISNIVGNVQAQQQAEQRHQAIVDSFNEGALSARIQEALENGEWPIAITDFNYTGHYTRDFALTNVSISDKQVDDGSLTAAFEATLENGCFRQITSGTAHLTLSEDGSSWQLDSWDFGASEAHPTTGASLANDSTRTLPDNDRGYGKVSFDSVSETSEVTYTGSGAQWFGEEAGTVVYHFTFDGTGWKLDKPQGDLKTTYNADALVGTYSNGAATTDLPSISLTIESLDNATGAVKASYTIEPAKSSSASSVSGSIEGTIGNDRYFTLEATSPAKVKITGWIPMTAGELCISCSAGEGLSVEEPYYVTVSKH